MKVALLGNGRTGGHVVNSLPVEDVTVFNESNLPTLDALKKHDVAIVFLPGPAFVDYIDLLIESGLPVANGSTGFEWSKDIDGRLKANNTAWVTASNFSLGMNLVYGMIKVLAKAPQLFDMYSYNLKETHHIHKKDQPSGTALTWQKWLGQDVEIESFRDGDNPGNHRLTLVTPYEDISTEHQAKDRKIYAEGAIWTAKKLLSGTITPGLHNLQDIMAQELNL